MEKVLLLGDPAVHVGDDVLALALQAHVGRVGLVELRLGVGQRALERAALQPLRLALRERLVVLRSAQCTVHSAHQ